MKIYLQFPSFSLQLFNSDDSFLSEIVLWNASVDFLKYLDFRKNIVLQSHTLFILHDQMEFNEKMKQVCIAPISSKKYICTDSEFYNFQVNWQGGQNSPGKKQKTLSKMKVKNFVVNMNLEADGQKLIQTKIEKLKIFLKPHIFLMMFEMFVYGLPQYLESSEDKPNFYDADSGNAPRMEIGC